MKKIIKIAAAAIAFMGISSCQGLLDIPSETSWGAGNFPTVESHIKGLLYGGYDYLQSALGTDFIRYGEARSDNFDLNKENNDTWKQIINNSLDTDISGSSWANFYNVVKQGDFGSRAVNASCRHGGNSRNNGDSDQSSKTCGR